MMLFLLARGVGMRSGWLDRVGWALSRHAGLTLATLVVFIGIAIAFWRAAYRLDTASAVRHVPLPAAIATKLSDRPCALVTVRVRHDAPYRDLMVLLRGLRADIVEGPDAQDRLRLRFTGGDPAQAMLSLPHSSMIEGLSAMAACS
jgi:hypothetical protein